ncbi:MAG: GIY-YIG nuclease family protein [Candidatus Margulisiibacteriota bacterium]
MWHIYILRCSCSTLYTGITTDVERRFAEHSAQGKKCAKYLRGKAPLELVFSAEAGNRGEATRLELLLKKCSKDKKEALIKGDTRLQDILKAS